MTGMPIELQALEMCGGYISKWGRKISEILDSYVPGKGGEHRRVSGRRYKHAAQDLARLTAIREELETQLTDFEH